ncbi:hypothetical protein LLG95_17280 [bacterium]|nr:hypothetical protein [bacterium]
MGEEKPGRRRRWALIVAGVVIGLPAIVIAMFNILFMVLAIPKESMTPPAKLLSLKADPIKAPRQPNWSRPLLTDADLKAYQRDYLALVRSKTTNPANIDILNKWLPRLNASSLPYFDVMEGMDPDAALDAEQVRWLCEHQDFIADMIRMANAGGFPTISCEQAAAFADEDLAFIKNPCDFMFGPLSSELAAEAKRRQDAGDLAGAADVILAIAKLGRSAEEPGLTDAERSIVTFGRNLFRPLAYWVQADVPPDLLKKMIEGLARPPADYRRQLEIDYRANRSVAVISLSGSIENLFVRELSTRYYGIDDFSEFKKNAWRHPASLILCVRPAFNSVKMKASAEGMIRQLDDCFAETMVKFRPENFATLDHDYFSPGAKYDQTAMTWWGWESGYFAGLIKTDRARLNVALTGIEVKLDPARSGATQWIDPFSGKPIRVVADEKGVVVYSFGPDRTDHHGEPSEINIMGGYEEGDIAIRILPRKK